MDSKTKLTIISGNIKAMEDIMSEIKYRIDAAKEGIEWEDAGSDERRVNSSLGGLSGVQNRIEALKSLVDVSFCIGRIE